MLKKIAGLSLCTCLLLVSAASFAGIRGGLTIMIDNNGFVSDPYKSHKLTYFITNLEEEIATGHTADTVGLGMRSEIELASYTKETLSAHIKVIDPDANGAVVWEGDVMANPNDKSIRTVLYNHDETHYQINKELKEANSDNRSLFHLEIKVNQ
jgi:hypothetical protein